MKKKILSGSLVAFLICLFSALGIFGLYRLGVFPEKIEPIIYSHTDISDRVYLKNSKLIGDETISVVNNKNEQVSVKIFPQMIEGFDTSTIGKKYLKVNYGGVERHYRYFVVRSGDDDSLNCISKVFNLHTTYYVNEEINLTDVMVEFNEVVNGYLITDKVPVISEMVSGFDSSSVGIKTLTINHKGYKYKVRYYIVEKNEEKITTESFSDDVYYAEATTEETEHFKIEIAAGTFVKGDYKTLIEEVYATMLDVTGLVPNQKIIIKLNNTYFPSCGANVIYINTYQLFLGDTSAFPHELAHALDEIQAAPIPFNNGVFKEGFASYVEYLTIKKIAETNPMLYAYLGKPSSVVEDINFLGERMYFYDFEEDLLEIKRDDIVPNSEYEIGSRFFAYLHNRYFDFCSVLKYGELFTEDVSMFVYNLEKYYKNDNLIEEFYEYEQAFGVSFKGFITAKEYADFVGYYNIDSDYSVITTDNLYFKMDYAEPNWGHVCFNYKDFYLNLETAKNQLRTFGYDFTNFSMKSEKPITIELYAANGDLIQTITTVEKNEVVDLTSVSFIKFVGAGAAMLNFIYS